MLIYMGARHLVALPGCGTFSTSTPSRGVGFGRPFTLVLLTNLETVDRVQVYWALLQRTEEEKVIALPQNPTTPLHEGNQS